MEGTTNDPEVLDVAALGGGLSGLATALVLQERGLSVRVLEANEMAGGRVRSLRDRNGGYLADLGPSWVWPPYQPSVARWIDRLGVRTFAQHETGDALIDLDPASVPHRRPLPGQHGMARIAGGPQALVDAITARLGNGTLRLGRAVREVRDDGTKALTLACADGTVLRADRIVVAVPPRIAATAIDWNGLIDERTIALMRAAPTWMAAQAKAVAVYDRPFWCERGLSGRVASQAGPLHEIHDHSGPRGAPAALFGFVGWPPADRDPATLHRAIRRQLERCFGPGAADPLRLHVEDWSTDETVCSETDRTGPFAHPSALPASIREPHANGRILLAGAETSAQSPGLIDGAFEAAERASRHVFRAPASAVRPAA